MKHLHWHKILPTKESSGQNNTNAHTTKVALV